MAIRMSLGPIWERDPAADIDCPVCLFNRGAGTAMAYLCLTGRYAGTHAYYCPERQREVSPVMVFDSFIDTNG